ncbi:helix-turn-helix domain-containing protein [Pedobacter sp. SYSU D00535]|uniref:helix-turn-helix domain-containing protein n=1 Tax=Pedobacter sp. SYSU D00535 TaxID=2810308 RepID=UPI001A97CACA|nr:helix-turn-helix transcriptional regulator [Pedobacter sp. SYSU D00535]
MKIDLKAAKRLELIYRDFKSAGKGAQKEFAELCGTSQPSISRMMKATQPITLEVIQNISVKLKYHPDWIVNGTGPTKYQEDKSTLITNIKNLQVENLILNARLKHIENETKGTHN